MAKERTEEFLARAAALERQADFDIEIVDVVRDKVRQVCVLGVIPNLLNGIEIRSVRREPLELIGAWIELAQFARGSAVSVQPIKDHKEIAAEQTMDLLDEGSDANVVEVLPHGLEVKPQTAELRRDGEASDDRQAIVPIPAVLNGRLAARRPSAPHDRLKHEARFVYEEDAAAGLAGSFFIRGQSFARHVWMVASFRSRARRSGFWQVQPNAVRIFHT